MLSAVAKGQYWQHRSKVWLEQQGFTVAPLQAMAWIKTADGFRPLKRDSFGADLLAVSRHRVIFAQCKGGETWRSGLAAAREVFGRYPLGPSCAQWIIGWEPRARDPEVIVVAVGPCDAQHVTIIPPRRRPKSLPLFAGNRGMADISD